MLPPALTARLFGSVSKSSPSQTSAANEGDSATVRSRLRIYQIYILMLKLELRGDLQDARFNGGSLDEAEGYILRS